MSYSWAPFFFFSPPAVARQQAHRVRKVHERHGGGPEDLQRQSQPQDRQTVRGHHHHQHHHKVTLCYILYSHVVLFFNQKELLKTALSMTVVRIGFTTSSQSDNKVTQFILQHHIMNHLQKPSSSPPVTNANEHCACTFQKQNESVFTICGKAFHTCIFLWFYT